MDDKKDAPERVMAALFEGKSGFETKRILARLERGGGTIYRALAASEKNEKARDALLAAAIREEENAKLLALMTQAKEACGHCNAPLAISSKAYTCSFQCTFCPLCYENHAGICPNCGGQLERRHTEDFAVALNE